MGTFGTIGTIAGSLGGPVGSAVGNVVGNTIDSIIQNKKAKEAFPDDNAPELQNYLEYVRSKLRTMETGSAAQNAMNDIKSSTASIVNAIGYQGGGSNSATNLQMAMRNQGDAFNQVLAGMDERSLAYNSIVANLVQRIQQRRDELGLVKYSQANAEKMQSMSDAQKNAMGLVVNQFNPMGGGERADFQERRTSFMDIIDRINNNRGTSGASTGLIKGASVTGFNFSTGLPTDDGKDLIDDPSGF